MRVVESALAHSVPHRRLTHEAISNRHDSQKRETSAQDRVRPAGLMREARNDPADRYFGQPWLLPAGLGTAWPLIHKGHQLRAIHIVSLDAVQLEPGRSDQIIHFAVEMATTGDALSSMGSAMLPARYP